jgi:hypothetical protein
MFQIVTVVPYKERASHVQARLGVVIKDLNVLLPDPFGPANIRRREILSLIEFPSSDPVLLMLMEAVAL